MISRLRRDRPGSALEGPAGTELAKPTRGLCVAGDSVVKVVEAIGFVEAPIISFPCEVGLDNPG